ncbi:acyl-CoA thioesterase [Sandaracinobacter neustonicus]|uniref:Acyl-CoA thioesterase n=1 Tax=Sandaracinobacter neustonicus TaxID=1715348 RepID=A0A501XRL7_9SPHN|nr:acyl-CoA thioesterase [Sandaracinobacter neustonicus]TPE62864.1 acyl-CoA thioesterase [Sandaracinobacter neustonicus]
MADSFRMALNPAPEDIDENGHVNNIVYVKWLQDVATSHWAAIAPAEAQARYLWVISRQEIDYRAPSFAGETLQAETWAENPKGARFDRYTRITGPDGSLRVQAKTTWVIMDRELKRPARLRPELIALFLKS